MKKALILLLVSIITFSCSSNDDETTQDPIIGKWQFEMVDDSGIVTVSNDCIKRSFLNFLSNKTVEVTNYRESSNGCVLDYSGTGTWSVNTSGNYTIIIGNTTLTRVEFPNTNSMVITDEVSTTSYTISTYRRI